jgi:hypothetical protein
MLGEYIYIYKYVYLCLDVHKTNLGKQTKKMVTKVVSEDKN